MPLMRRVTGAKFWGKEKIDTNDNFHKIRYGSTESKPGSIRFINLKNTGDFYAISVWIRSHNDGLRLVNLLNEKKLSSLISESGEFVDSKHQEWYQIEFDSFSDRAVFLSIYNALVEFDNTCREIETDFQETLSINPAIHSVLPAWLKESAISLEIFLENLFGANVPNFCERYRSNGTHHAVSSINLKCFVTTRDFDLALCVEGDEFIDLLNPETRSEGECLFTLPDFHDPSFQAEKQALFDRLAVVDPDFSLREKVNDFIDRMIQLARDNEMTFLRGRFDDSACITIYDSLRWVKVPFEPRGIDLSSGVDYRLRLSATGPITRMKVTKNSDGRIVEYEINCRTKAEGERLVSTLKEKGLHDALLNGPFIRPRFHFSFKGKFDNTLYYFIFKTVAAFDPTCGELENNFLQFIGFQPDAHFTFPVWLKALPVEMNDDSVPMRVERYIRSDQNHLVRSFTAMFFLIEKQCRIICEFVNKSEFRKIFNGNLPDGLEESLLNYAENQPVQFPISLNQRLKPEDFIDNANFKINSDVISFDAVDADGSLLRAIFDVLKKFAIEDAENEQRRLQERQSPHAHGFFDRMRGEEFCRFVDQAGAFIPEDTRHAFSQEVGENKNSTLLSEAGIDPNEIPDEMLCPISLSIMDNPVVDPTTLTENRDNFDTVRRLDRSCLIRAAVNGNYTSPFTRRNLSLADIIPDLSLKLKIEEFVSRKLIEVEESKSRLSLA